MKFKTLSILAAIGMAANAFGQGVVFDNLGNSGAANASTGGRVFINNGTTTSLFDGGAFNLGVTVLGGTSVGTLVNLGTFTFANDPKGYTGADIGQFQLGAAGASVNIPGVAAGGIATIQLQMWFDGANGLFANYAAAAAGGGYVGTVTFTSGTSNPAGAPPVPAPNFSAMPSITLAAAPVPEPTTFALAGLGSAALLIFRRRKS